MGTRSHINFYTNIPSRKPLGRCQYRLMVNERRQRENGTKGTEGGNGQNPDLYLSHLYIHAPSVEMERTNIMQTFFDLTHTRTHTHTHTLSLSLTHTHIRIRSHTHCFRQDWRLLISVKGFIMVTCGRSFVESLFYRCDASTTTYTPNILKSTS